MQENLSPTAGLSFLFHSFTNLYRRKTDNKSKIISPYHSRKLQAFHNFTRLGQNLHKNASFTLKEAKTS